MTTELVPPLKEVTTRELRALASEVFTEQESRGFLFEEFSAMVGAIQERFGANWNAFDTDFIRELVVEYLAEEIERYINVLFENAVEYPMGEMKVSYRPTTW